MRQNKGASGAGLPLFTRDFRPVRSRQTSNKITEFTLRPSSYIPQPLCWIDSASNLKGVLHYTESQTNTHTPALRADSVIGVIQFQIFLQQNKWGSQKQEFCQEDSAAIIVLPVWVFSDWYPMESYSCTTTTPIGAVIQTIKQNKQSQKVLLQMIKTINSLWRKKFYKSEHIRIQTTHSSLTKPAAL